MKDFRGLDMTNPNAVPKPWLVQVRDRFSDRWATDSGWADWESLIPYAMMIAESLTTKTAEVHIFHQETGEVPFSVENPACSNCTHWRRCKFRTLDGERLGPDLDGTCACMMTEDSLPLTHQDFWCVLHEENSDDDDE